MISASDCVGVASPAWLYVSVLGQTRRPAAQVGEVGEHGNIVAASCSLTSAGRQSVHPLHASRHVQALSGQARHDP